MYMSLGFAVPHRVEAEEGAAARPKTRANSSRIGIDERVRNVLQHLRRMHQADAARFRRDVGDRTGNEFVCLDI